MTTVLSSSWAQFLLTALHLVVVFFDFGIIGWLLHGFNVPASVWVGTLLICCYLIWVGSGGIALASVWVVGLMSMAAINHQWLDGLPRPRFRYIPLLLLTNWLFSLFVVWQAGVMSDRFRKKGFSRLLSFIILIGLVAIGLIAGWQFYTETRLFLTSVLL